MALNPNVKIQMSNQYQMSKSKKINNLSLGFLTLIWYLAFDIRHLPVYSN